MVDNEDENQFCSKPPFSQGAKATTRCKPRKKKKEKTTPAGQVEWHWNASDWSNAYGTCPNPAEFAPPPPVYWNPYSVYAPYVNHLGIPMVPVTYASMGGVPAAPPPYDPLSMHPGRGLSSAATGAEELRGRGSRRNRARTAENTADPSPSHSVLLAQLREHNSMLEHSLVEVVPDVFDFARDELGCSFLQCRMENASAGNIEACFAATLPHAADLARDKYGKLFLLKLFEVCNVEQKATLVAELQPHILRLAKDKHGCHIVQVAIRSGSRESHRIIAAKLGRNTVGCIKSKFGIHVVQACIKHMPPDLADFIFATVESEKDMMMTHTYGSRVVQSLLGHCKAQQLEVLLRHAMGKLHGLCTNLNGNKVIQHMLQHGSSDDKKRIINVVKDDIVWFSNHRIGGRVVAKCFEVSARGEHMAVLDEERKALSRAVFGDPGDPRPSILDMLEDTFGRRVLLDIDRYLEYADRMLLREFFTA